MTTDLSLILDGIPADAPKGRYRQAIVEDNILGKATRSTRLKAAQHLSSLYALDPTATVFRLLRHLWAADRAGRPMLAYLAAAARDRLLRDSSSVVLGVPRGEKLDAFTISTALAERYPARFRATTLHSTAQNLASSWTQAGYLSGKSNKLRVAPVVTPQVAAYALVLAYLTGSRGKLLLESFWAGLLDRKPAEMLEIATDASKQGWLRLKAAGSVIEITFPGLLRPAEERLAHEPN